MRPPVLNSSLFALRDEHDPETNFVQKNFGSSALRMGVIIETYESDDKNNISKIGPEYDVMTIEQDGNKGINSSVYRNCIYLDSFGGIADFFQVKRRKPKDPKKVQKKASLKDQEGNIVLLLCLDGNTDKAVIIGSVVNPNKKTTLTKDKGVHLEGEYNGVNWKVDKDGAMTVTFRGATDEDGKPKTSDGGSEIKIEKDGSVEINDKKLANTKGYRVKQGDPQIPDVETPSIDKYEKIRIDKTKQTVDVYARKDINVESDLNLNFKSTLNTKMTMLQMTIEAQGTVNLVSGGIFDIKSDGPFSLKAPVGQMKFDGPLQIQASVTQVKSQLIMLGSGGTPAVTLNTQFLGFDSVGAPVVSSSIGPWSSVVYISN